LREERCGRIAPGYRADLLVLPDRGLDPYATLIEAQMSDIALLCRAGVPVYGDLCFESLFEQYTPNYSRVRMCDPASNPSVQPQIKLAAGDPVALLQRLSETVGRPLDLPFLPLITNEEQTQCPVS
jgi:hypothetical protein